MLTNKIKIMLSANAAIHDALIDAEAEDIAINFLHGSKKCDECERLIVKTNAIKDVLNAAAKNEFVAQAAFAKSEVESDNDIEFKRHMVFRDAAFIIYISILHARNAEIDAHGFGNADLFDEFRRLDDKTSRIYCALRDESAKFFQTEPQTDTDQSEVVA